MKIETISVGELDNYARRNDVIIIDVRNEADFRKKHICGARNIQLENIEKINLEKGKMIILYCERGASSLLAASRLQKNGYRVKSVVGGINAYKGSLLCKD